MKETIKAPFNSNDRSVRKNGAVFSQSICEGNLPSDAMWNQPNKETIAAMLEAERIAKDPSVKGYTDLDQLFADLRPERIINNSASDQPIQPVRGAVLCTSF
ncbi:hypothetical protein [Anaeromassilibacillus senegalensis]